MWAFELRFRDQEGTLTRSFVPLAQQIENLRADFWEDAAIAGMVLRGAKWIDSPDDKIEPDGTPSDLVPKQVTSDSMIDLAIEYLKISERNPINGE